MAHRDTRGIHESPITILASRVVGSLWNKFLFWQTARHHIDDIAIIRSMSADVTYRDADRDFRLTDVHGRVINELTASPLNSDDLIGNSSRVWQTVGPLRGSLPPFID